MRVNWSIHDPDRSASNPLLAFLMAAKTFRQTVFGPVSILGMVTGFGFAWIALTPSLLPRGWLYQGAALALSATFGYAVGTTLGWLLRVTAGRSVEATRARLWLFFAIGLGTLLVLALIFWPTWQNDQRALVQLEPTAAAVDVLKFIAVGMALTVVLVLIGRLFGFLLTRFDRWLAKRLPRAVAYGIGALLFAAVVYVLSVDVVFHEFLGWANSTYEAGDQETREGDTQPQSELRSGSPESLASWDTLGVEGRAFVAGGSTAEEISNFTGEPASEPIRVYVGLGTADSYTARADLVLEELSRTGAWDREAVIIWSTTGTGWVDPDAATTVEHMFGGNTAIAGMQYSFLPSWISFMVDQQKAADSAGALFDAMLGAWSELPEDDRPELLLFGESLGSFGAETAIGGDTLEESAAAAEQTDGVVLLGPTNSNILWQQLIEDRNDSSPTWRPHSDKHPEVLVGNRVGELPPEPVDLELGRIAYYHHPSDPVGYWNWETLWKPQLWDKDPIGYDVSPNIDWYPFVSFWHVVFDLIAGFSAPSGYGHSYAIDMPDIWAAVAAPAGWTAEDSIRLRDHLGLNTNESSS